MLLALSFLGGTLQAQVAHQLTVRNDLFDPEFLVVEAGDTIDVRLTGPHTFTEVSAATFRANGVASHGGIRLGPGQARGAHGSEADEGVVVLAEPGEHYFVSEAHGAVGTRMRVVVLPARNTGLSAAVDRSRPLLFPNPANDQVRFGAHGHLDMMTVEVFDPGGRRVLHTTVRGNQPLDLYALPSGLYTIRLSDGLSTIHGVERLIIERQSRS